VTSPTVERYLRLGLRLGRHVDGLVDSYIGPPEIEEAVAAEPLLGLPALAAEAERLLGELDDGWLRDQVVGLRMAAALAAGERIAFVDEAEACFGYRPQHTDESVFEAAHARLEELLPGDGTLGERYERWRSAGTVPVERLEETARAAIAEARAWTSELVDLPDGEAFELELVRDVNWLGFNRYLGGLRGRISVNVDLPRSGLELLALAIHESYPGHQAERVCKEQHLVRERGMLEETLVVIPAPQSLVSEGIAELAPLLVLSSDAGPRFAGVLREAGIELDLEHALAVERAAETRRWAQVNAALMLFDGGAGEDEVRDYLQRWALSSPEMAAHWYRFISRHPSRAYVLTYAAGRDLCRAFVADEPARGLRRLLTEQVRAAELVEAARRPASPA
jgi:hypothetical protein